MAHASNGSVASGDDVAEAVYSFKLLEALRKGDQQALIPLLQPSAKNSNLLAKESTSPLHLAVKCADFNIISFLLNYKTIDLNAVEAQQGNTALHIASASGRDDVVQLLLDQNDIDDSKLNKDGRDALAVAKTPEIAQQIQVSRAQLNVKYLDLLTAYEQDAAGADVKIHQLLDLPRHAVIDLNASSSNGSTLLHEAVKRKDTRMIETAVRKGADVYARDRRGKRVNDVTKDEKVKALLRQLHNADAAKASQASQSGQPPSFKGYLGKWTNIAHGYKTRWFVLEDGILSYYHSQDDEGKQSRGAINMRYAKIRADNNDKHRLEILSETGKGTSKLYLRGTHSVERARWVQVLQQTKEFFNLERQSSRATATESIYRQRAPSSSSLSAAQGIQGATVLANPAGIVRPSSTAPSEKGSRSGLLSLKSPSTQPPSGAASERSLPLLNRSPSLLSRLSSDERADDDAGASAAAGRIPYESEFSLTAETLKAQAEASQRLVETLLASNALASGSVDGSESKHSRVSSGSLASNGDTLRSALEAAVRSNHQLVERYQTMVSAREIYMTKRYERELQIKHLWEENMAVLAQQHAEMESQLKEAAAENARRRKALREVRETMGSSPGSILSPGGAGVGIGAGLAASGSMASSLHNARRHSTLQSYETADSDNAGSLAARRLGEQGSAQLQLDDQLTPPIQGQRSAIMGIAEDTSMARDSMDDAEDDFFDAIETGDLPGLKVEQALSQPETDTNKWPEKFDKNMIDDLVMESFEPYKHLRTHMPIGKDDRPSVSLWAILKNNIGKDLTKISFPVSFNEPTSMLQRMAEDMEFSECLDAASMQEDSTKRIAYVAAFAMSNYSSTIGRIAKPFNPLLGETFEYMRPDKKYRYYSEQVSHHPPISACFAQSPTWDYMGCVDAKSKFLGRTFEIRPTGVAHVNLKVPRKWVNTDKELKSAPLLTDDHVMEHYSWNKVTTSVSGFIVGSPTIDHFGDMEVTNHATGDRCVLTFKPRGWRGKDAFEIRGSVYDAQGTLRWDIAGRWNSQLVARKCGAGSGDLNPDQTVDAPDGQIATAQPLAEYLLLWRNSDKPASPFNLTPFAITLNSCPDDLRPWLAPTDCRLRPDLSAFESGKFDQANDLKQKLENYQRETRKKRETGELPPHEPRWFKRTTDPDTREQLWQPAPATPGTGAGGKETTSYWAERYDVGSKKTKGQQADWNNVYHIFGDFEVR
ncbi:Oxysterol-binding protein-like protein [Pseudozyma hubeiensis]|nr:Oxysterol-binding protein-like protein [Pseudozyma hubeiensis]